jgi:penicillin-binding protein 1A
LYLEYNLAKKKAATASKAKKSTKAKKKTKKRSIISRLIKFVFIASFLLFILGALSVVGLFWYYSQSLPNIFSYDDYQPKQVTRIYDNQNRPILELFDERRTVVAFNDISPNMKNAMIASEDAGFYTHKGLDYVGVIRAVFIAVKRRKMAQGASTITQQVVKNLLLTPEKAMSRKIQEALLARRLEKVLSKDEILSIYLNHSYFGHLCYGVEEAALYYFGTSAKDLSLNQAATLAGLVQSPARLSPIKYPERAKERRNYVLRQLWEKGFIAEAEYQTALAQEIVTAKHEESQLGKAPYFAEHVRQLLIERWGRDYVYNAGFQVHTTVDLTAQAFAEQSVEEGLFAFDERRYLNRPLKNPKGFKKPKKWELNTNYEAKVQKVTESTVDFALGDQVLTLKIRKRNLRKKAAEDVYKVGDTWFVQVTKLSNTGIPESIDIPEGANASLIAIEPKTRAVVALVGGFSYADSVFNRATQAKRQTGSSFKTFVFGAALEDSVISSATVIDDAPKVFHIPGQKKPWSPQNSDKKFKGPMSARVALAQSRNTIAVDILERTGIDRVIAYVRKLGVKSSLVENFTLALGSSEMSNLEATNAYATILDAGVYKEALFIQRIEQNGKSIELAPQESHVATTPQAAFILSDMLQSVAREGTARGRLAKWKQPVAGKTGTTNMIKDAWFVGFTPQLACGVFVGYDEPRSLGRGEGGASTALPIWEAFMRRYHEGMELQDFSVPEGIVWQEVDTATGLLPNNTGPTRKEPFIAGTEPKELAPAADSFQGEQWMMQQLEEQGQDIPSDDPLDLLDEF